MAAVLRDSTYYGIGLSKYKNGRIVPLIIDLTAASPATLADTYNLCVIPAYARVVDLFLSTDGLGSSVTISVGDSGNAARYVAAATSMATSGLTAGLAAAGLGYTPTADTIVVVTGAGAAFTVGKKLVGHMLVVPVA